MREKMRYIYVMPLLLLTAAVVAGSLRAAGLNGADEKALTTYLHSFFESVPGGTSALLVSSLKKQLIIWLVIGLSGSVLPGCILCMATVCERGFVIGYTAAGFFRVYGTNGVLACLSLFPEMVVFIPALVVFSSISLKMAFFRHENKKLFLKKYIIFNIFFLSVFCAVSIFQTFLTTIFMRWAAMGL